MASFFSRKSENREEAQELEKLTAPEETDSEEKINLADIADNSPISVQLGYGLIGMVDEESGYGEDRKDISRMIKVFYEAFANKKEQPALILKTNGATHTQMDR